MELLCNKCKIKHPLSDFYTNRKTGKPIQPCKRQKIIRAKAWYRKNHERYLEYHRQYNKENGCRNTPQYQAQRKKKYPKPIYCNQIIHYLLKGKWIQRQPCEVCGDKKVVAHHDDYDHPFDVRWLCQLHHKTWHSLNGHGKHREVKGKTHE